MYFFKQHSGAVSYPSSYIIYRKLLSASETEKSTFIILFLHTTTLQTYSNSWKDCGNQSICRYGQKYPSLHQQFKGADQEIALIPYKYKSGQQRGNAFIHVYRVAGHILPSYYNKCNKLHTTINVINSFRLIDSKRKDIDGVFRFIGFLDVICSLSFLREELPYYCHPAKQDNDEKLLAKSVYHPLIDNCIPNDISISTKSILITGSNMSGKTSFIRTIAINAITGKVLNTCFANEFRIDTDRRILSVINTEDDLENGKSYFLTETENVKKVFDCAISGNYLLVFDELFKGTNTAERISINAAVLKELAGHNNIVLASTHDNELTSLLDNEYELYHFCEDIENDTLAFDYKIKKGTANEGNAIKILGLYGYPDYITKEAEKIRNCGTFTGSKENK